QQLIVLITDAHRYSPGESKKAACHNSSAFLLFTFYFSPFPSFSVRLSAGGRAPATALPFRRHCRLARPSACPACRAGVGCRGSAPIRRLRGAPAARRA